MAILPYSRPVKQTTKEEAMRTIVEAYRKRIKSQYPKSVFETEFVLGTTVDKFAEYLESMFPPGMNWQNHGKWKVVPVKPIRDFDLAQPDEFYTFFRWDNYKPQWAQGRGFVADPEKPQPIDRYAEEV